MEVDTEATGLAYIRMWLPLARGPLDPLMLNITAILNSHIWKVAHYVFTSGRC
jgi:hypothetical protein